MAIEREECCQEASIKTMTCTYHVRAVYKGTRGMCPLPPPDYSSFNNYSVAKLKQRDC